MCRNGISTVEFNQGEAILKGVGIQCVKRVDVQSSLIARQKLNIDPFRRGFFYDLNSINLNAVRLCFQVCLETSQFGIVKLSPFVSDVIKDNKAYGDLKIVKCSHNYAPFHGRKKILIFTSKVSRNDIEVHFRYRTKGKQIFKCVAGKS